MNILIKKVTVKLFNMTVGFIVMLVATIVLYISWNNSIFVVNGLKPFSNMWQAGFTLALLALIKRYWTTMIDRMLP
jgi:hypothetical protein